MTCVFQKPVYGLIFDDIPAWDGGARSVQSFEDDCYFGVTAPLSNSGAVVGFNTNDTSYHYSEIRHGFRFRRGEYRVIEGGIYRDIWRPFTLGDRFYVFRLGSNVLYIRSSGRDTDFNTFDPRYPGIPLPDEVVYSSLSPSYGRVFLDASLYEANDYVYNEEGNDFWLPADVSGGPSPEGFEAFGAGRIAFGMAAYGSATAASFNGFASGALEFGLEATTAPRNQGYGELKFRGFAGDQLRGWARGGIAFGGGLANGLTGSDGLGDGISGKARGFIGFGLVGAGYAFGRGGRGVGGITLDGIATGSQGSTEPVDEFFSDVTLLLDMEESDNATVVIDKSEDTRTVTSVGTVAVDYGNPHEGSGALQLPGSTNNYIHVANSSALLDPLDDWTVEFTVDVNAFGARQVIFSTRADVASTGLALRIEEDGTLRTYGFNDSSVLFDSDGGDEGQLVVDTYQAIVLQHDVALKTIYIFLEGTLVDSVTYTGNLTLGASEMRFGGQDRSAGQFPLGGHLDEVRITNGRQRYPIVVGDDFWSDVEFFVNAENGPDATTFINEADSVIVPGYFGTPERSSTDPIRGAFSAEMVGDEGITSPGLADIGTTDDFTIEFKVRWDVGASNYDVLVDNGPSATPLRIDRSGSGLPRFMIGSFSADIEGTVALANDVEYAIALSRVSGNLRAFVDGTQVGATSPNTDAVTMNVTTGLIFGCNQAGAIGLNGQMDEMRFTRAGRYDSNYTVNPGEFPTDGGPPVIPDDEFPTDGPPVIPPTTGTDGVSAIGYGTLGFTMTAYSASLGGDYLLLNLPGFTTGDSDALQTYIEELTDVLVAAASIEYTGMSAVDISDAIVVGEAGLEAYYVFRLNETIRTSETIRLFSQTAVELLDSFGVRSAVEVATAIALQDALRASEEVTVIEVVTLLEQVMAAQTHQTAYTAVQTLLSAVALSDAEITAFSKTLTDGITLSDEARSTIAYLAAITDALTVGDSLQHALTLVADFSDGVEIEESAELTAQYFASLIDRANVYLLFKTPAELAQGWVMNTEAALPISEYDNYDFNSLAFTGVQMVGTSDDGVYILEGDDDAGVAIDSVLTSMMLDFGSSRQKRVRSAYLGYTSDGQLILKVRTASNGQLVEDWYRAEKVAAQPAPGENYYKVGQGLKSRYWQFELVNEDGADFEVDHLEMHPIFLSRRV